VARMRESMAQLTPQFSANRTVREYTEQNYIPAAAAYRQRVADKGAMGVQLVNWQRAMEQHWSDLRFGEMKVATDGGNHLFKVQIYLSGLDPNTVRVALYADRVNGGEPVRQDMTRGQQLAGVSGGYVYSAAVSAARPTADYTVRVIPRCDGVAIPLEDARILWQR
jgi:glycogen phosphorylase